MSFIRYVLYKYFLPTCAFILLSFADKFSFLMKSNLPMFSFMDHAFGLLSKNSLPNPKSPRFSPILYTYLAWNVWIFHSFSQYNLLLHLRSFWTIHSSFPYISDHISKSLIFLVPIFFLLRQSSPWVSKGPLIFQFSNVSGLTTVFSDFWLAITPFFNSQNFA